MLHIVSAITFAAGVASATLDSAELRREDLMTALRTGGYTVILRHARTDRSFQEQIGAIPEKRAEQRNLSDDGFRDAAGQTVDRMDHLSAEFREDPAEILPHRDDPLPDFEAHLLDDAHHVSLRFRRGGPHDEVRSA